MKTQNIIGGEANRREPGAVEPAGEQHTEGLMRKPSGKGIECEIMPPGARKNFDQQAAGARRHADLGLGGEPFRHLRGKGFFMAGGDQFGDAGGERFGHRQPPAQIRGDDRRGICARA